MTIGWVMLRRRLIGFTGLLLFTAHITYAQDFKTTLLWMHNSAAAESSYTAMSSDGHVENDVIWEMEVPLTNTCQKFNIIQKRHFVTSPPKELNVPQDSVFTTSMNLAAIDPNKVRFSSWGDRPGAQPGGVLEFGTTNDEDAIYSGGEKGSSEGFFSFIPRDFGQRLANAFRHAVELCGGKPSAF